MTRGNTRSCTAVFTCLRDVQGLTSLMFEVGLLLRIIRMYVNMSKWCTLKGAIVVC